MNTDTTHSHIIHALTQTHNHSLRSHSNYKEYEASASGLKPKAEWDYGTSTPTII